MKAARCILALSWWACATACLAGHGEWSGYPTKDVVYKFEVYTGTADQWDSASTPTPALSPGKASLAAKQFVRTVPLRDDMKEWDLQSIALKRMASSPEEWIYIVRFDATPKANVWNGPVPWIEVPVRLDGTIPKPKVTK